eukprot:CAMPEP_0182853164 /NCGR_PEP_ID=MMETSP0034_2-20130328/553_1 /TAXON_ID=156128 /ORGANISM="Nephroselmis pyriformis, Strain CCMP717" /LENGTH=142 /DNA_ID=CAMNT_0024983919 /DNA_START=297 /DNA_END=726 /DNA_ORIENTATION=-
MSSMQSSPTCRAGAFLGSKASCVGSSGPLPLLAPPLSLPDRRIGSRGLLGVRRTSSSTTARLSSTPAPAVGSPMVTPMPALRSAVYEPRDPAPPLECRAPLLSRAAAKAPATPGECRVQNDMLGAPSARGVAHVEGGGGGGV